MLVVQTSILEASKTERAATKKDVAEYLRVTVRTVENLMKAGVVPFYRIGSLVRFDMDLVKSEMRARTQGGARK
jgi:excisionase family DNA binding protein